MKLVINILLISTVFSCKAQTIIKSLDGDGPCPPYDTNCYEKDVNNEFDKFEGTWKYQNGTTELILELKKEIHYQIYNDRNFEDLLVGEYQYTENGIEKANTLINFDNPLVSGYNHKISGGIFTRRLPNFCIDNSSVSEIKVKVRINHPTEKDTEGKLILRYVNSGGVEKIQACIFDYTTMGDKPDARIDIPDGYYELIKQ